MRKLIVLLLLPIFLISSTSRWELDYHGSGEDTNIVVKSTFWNYAIVSDSTLWVASANDSMVGDSFPTLEDVDAVLQANGIQRVK